MGTALTAGLLVSKTLRPSQIFVTDVRPETRATLRGKYGVRVGTDNIAAVSESDTILLCVKPHQMGNLLAEVRTVVQHRPLVISIAAGIRTGFIEKNLGGAVPVIRVMPNTPALLRAGALVYCLGRKTNKAHETLARALLTPMGQVWKVSETQMDAVTALSGSGPAYVFYLAECLTAAGCRIGLSEPMAEALARQTIYGAGLMLKGNESAATLRRRVTSPGGTTEVALKVLEKEKVPQIFARALSAARRRAHVLSGN